VSIKVKIAGIGNFLLPDSSVAFEVSGGEMLFTDTPAGENSLSYLASGGASAGAILGDGTVGLAFRMSRVTISKGTDFGIKVVITSKFNGSTYTMDNIVKGYDSGGFKFDANGYQITIGDPIFQVAVGAIAYVAGNRTGSVLISDAEISSNSVLLTFTREDGSYPDVELAVAPNNFYVDILYLTSE